MSNVITEISWDMNQPLPNGRFVELYRCVEHCPQVLYFQELKKGRGETQQATQAALANASANTAKQNEQYGAENGAINNLTAIGANGLGMGASGYLANQLQAIGKNYANARQNVARQNAVRGFSATPEGAFTSGINSANMSQAGSENQAYNDAQLMTRENTLAGINARQGLQTTYSPVPSLNTAIGGGQAMNQQGSLAGDIFKGIGTAAGIAGSVAGLPNAFANGGWTS